MSSVLILLSHYYNHPDDVRVEARDVGTRRGGGNQLSVTDLHEGSSTSTS